MVFDFDWSDELAEAVRPTTFHSEPGRTDLLRGMNEALSVLSFSMFQTLGRDHPFAYVWYELQTDVNASVYLAYGGYYKQAFSPLRSWLQLAYAGAFFETRPNDFRGWRDDLNDTPSVRTVCTQLWPERTPQWAIGARELEESLGRTIHNRGLGRSRFQDGRDNVPRYVAHAYGQWFNAFERCFAAYIVLIAETHSDDARAYLSGAPEETRRLRISTPSHLLYLLRDVLE